MTAELEALIDELEVYATFVRANIAWPTDLVERAAVELRRLDAELTAERSAADRLRKRMSRERGHC